MRSRIKTNFSKNHSTLGFSFEFNEMGLLGKSLKIKNEQKGAILKHKNKEHLGDYSQIGPISNEKKIILDKEDVTVGVHCMQSIKELQRGKKQN